MFTGIVQTKAKVIKFVGDNTFRTLTVEVADEHLKGLTIGASIAINGVCLTVTQFKQSETPDNASEVVNDSQLAMGIAQFDIIDETLKLTNLKNLTQGQFVNFERSVTFGTELGGHIVSGHIQTSAIVEHIESSVNNCKITLGLDKAWMKYILHKGFVSVNGSSLTVGNTTESSFDLHLIPETLKLTNLSEAKVGDKLNIEVDQQTFTTVQTVEKYLKQYHS